MRRRQHTPLSEVSSNEEMDARIAALAKRNGIGGELVVRRVAPTAGAAARASAAEAVLEVLAAGKPAAVDFLSYVTGLSRPTVANAVTELAGQGRIVSRGTKRRAKGAPQRMWEVAP